MNTTELAELARLKQGARATWAAGDFPAIAERQLWEVGPRVVEAADVHPGDAVLDVACGTGNAALRAAQAGGDVVGLDLTPELFDAGRKLATELHVAVDWVQGDAEDLPFEDESFDVVLSTFGCMFAPRHQVTAHELARVLRPGGRLAVASWTPDGGMGAFFRMVGPYLPPPSPLAQPPALWGSEEHVEQLFEGSGIELEFERDVASAPPFESSDDAVEFITSKFGPMIMVKQMTEASGRWAELRTELAALYERDLPAEYLLTLGTEGGAMSLGSRLFAARYDSMAKGPEEAGLLALREQLLSGVSGRVVEIGAGTGRNLEFYGDGVELTVTEPDSHMARRLEQRIEERGRPVELVQAPAEDLPFEDGQFDVAVSTLVLCGVDDQARALGEVRRVLKPGGELIFIEHVRSDEPKLARWQDRLNPLNRVVARCNCNRPTVDAIRAAGFTITKLERDELQKVPPFVRPLAVGTATPNGGSPSA